MAALFEVPGWSVPATPSGAVSKKRKRPSNPELNKIHGVEANMEKLMKKLRTGVDKGPRDKQRKVIEGREGNGKVNKIRGEDKLKKMKKGDKGGEKVNKSKKKQKERATAVENANSAPPLSSRTKQSRSKNGVNSKSAGDSLIATKIGPSGHTPDDSGLTPLQKSMKQSLDGARFRWINEVLYKTSSAEARRMMQEDPNVYEEYHSGFRHQVQSWPTNPVSHYIESLSSYPPKTVVVDLGCGDAALARALIPKEMTVLSYDLVSNDDFVVEADICGRVPLPGSEGEDEESEGKGHVVDVVICALSLMGTNWVNCIREAWRILKPSGELKIAEVTSRFTDEDEFTSLIGSVGFKLKSKDDRNTHFTLFEFKKVGRTVKSDKEWHELIAKGTILKPCEYKRR